MLKSKNLSGTKFDYYYGMDLKDLQECGAFMTDAEWDFIMKPEDKVVIKPHDFTRR
jgi:hypothetical protein